MPRPSPSRAALQTARVVKQVSGQRVQATSSGTIIPIPGDTIAFSVWGDGAFRLRLDGAATVADAAYIPGSTLVTFGLDPRVGSVGFAVASGTVNVDVTWLQAEG